jgi:hypothetical protein
MKPGKRATLDLIEILFLHNWSPFEVTRLFYGHQTNKDGSNYELNSRGFNCHWHKLLNREFKYDGNPIEGTDGDEEFLQFNLTSSDNRYIIYRKKK